MHIAALTIVFYLPGCRSLKEKRRRLRKLADHFGGQQHVAVVESGQQDSWQSSRWTFVVASNQRAMTETLCQRIESYCHELDAYVTDRELEFL